MQKLLLIVLLFPSSFLFSQEVDFTKIPQIQTKATYTTEVQPDKITLEITLSESHTKGKATLEELESKLERVLIDNQINISKQLTLKDLSSNFQTYFLKRTDVQKAKNYHLEVADAKTAGKILRELANDDISNIKLLKTEYSKLEELRIELKGKAIAKAKQQAEEMLKPLNQKLGSAIYISDMETRVDLGGYLAGRVAGINSNFTGQAIRKQETDLEISFDNIKVEATVIVLFKIEP